MGLFRRPFESVATMDAEMERRWNATVGPQDEVWHLGDVAIGPRAIADCLSARLGRLHGRKHLVTGNGDPEAMRSWPGWASVQPYTEIVADGVRLVLCHYALRSWNGMGRGALNLHGHSHGGLTPMPRQFDVGVDAWDFRPVPLEQLRRAGPRRRAERRGLATEPPRTI